VIYRPIQGSDEHTIETVIAWRRQDTSPTLKALIDLVRRSLGRRRRSTGLDGDERLEQNDGR
jgi:hypothetical protein